ncbi:MAG: hypothetical protein AB7I01_07765 [Gammaproteobacteria bacterium]
METENRSAAKSKLAGSTAARAAFFPPELLGRGATSLLVCLCLTGCAVPFQAKDGTVHHVIVGFGVVSTPRPSPDAIEVVRSHALGLSVDDSPAPRVSLGYSSSVITSVEPAGVEAIVDVEASPFGHTRVSARADRSKSSPPVSNRKEP